MTDDRLFDEVACLLVGINEGGDLLEQRLVAGAGLRQKRVALTGRALKGGV